MGKPLTQYDIYRLNIILQNMRRFLGKDLRVEESHCLDALSRQNVYQYLHHIFFPRIDKLAYLASRHNAHIVEFIFSPEEIRHMLSQLIIARGVDIHKKRKVRTVWKREFLASIATNMKHQRRDRLRLSLAQVHERTNGCVSITSLSRYERGGDIDTRSIIPIAEALEMTPLELITPRRNLISVVVLLTRKYKPALP